jgi:predicted porin
MKKSLVALAALAVVGAASAQSSVTLFGVVDAAVQSIRGDGNGSVLRMATSSNASSRLGFRGVEDLGGGMSASFWLEAGLNNDSGLGAGSNTNNQAGGAAAAPAGTQGLVFNRRSTVSLNGGFGEVRFGRDYTPSFWNLTVFDPFGTLGVASSSNLTNAQGVFAAGITAVRASLAASTAKPCTPWVRTLPTLAPPRMTASTSACASAMPTVL